MLDCKRLSKDARIPQPVPNINGCYQLFLQEDLQLPSNTWKNVDVGLLVKLPKLHKAIMVSDENSTSRGILVNQYNSLNEITRDVDSEIPRLSFIVYNIGLSDIFMPKHTPLGRLMVVQTANLKVNEVDNFDKVSTELIPLDTTNTIEEIPKTEAIFFKRMYRTDYNRCCELFLSDVDGAALLDKINDMKKTNTYKNNRNKTLYEAKYAWEEMSQATKTIVIREFESYKKNIVKKMRETSG